MRGHVSQAGVALTRAWLMLALAALACSAHADELDAYVQRQREVYDIPAVVVGVIRGGRLVDSRAAGVSHVELGVMASTQHVFEIGSISKQFTAYGLLMLVEQGQAELTAPVGRYLPELPPAWARPTLHELLGHVSGLPDFEGAFDYGIYREVLTDADFQQRLFALPIDFEPGTKWAYSNTNYWLLARVIERLSGMSYGQFMAQRIFAPLGMNATRTSLPNQILPGRAAGYRMVDERLENREPMQPGTGRGLGDIATTISDMVRWENEQRMPHLLKPETARLALQTGRLKDGTATDYGYGWFTHPLFDQPALRHDGQTAGFVAEYLRLPQRDLAIVVLSNLYGAPLLARRIARLVDPSVGPALTPVPGGDAQRQRLVEQLAASAAHAAAQWPEQWFEAEFWRAIKPFLREIEDRYRRRGALRSVTLVGPAGVADTARPSYRVVFEKATRVMTFHFDDQGRIRNIDAEDE